ncbi:MAG: tetratricopeptide repeat protein [Deltaproteobacteria bacterium]|nr:tetratricopeptide repeat protein [Deltaproteobacteria bacterium]
MACPAGARKAAAKEGGNAPVSRMKAAEPKKAKKQGPTGPSLQIDLSTRLGREQTRARAENLLEREIAILQRLVKNSADDDPRRPQVLLRLAETQFEMQIAKNAKVRSFDDPIYEACTRDKDKARCKQARDGQKAAQADLDKIREDSIRTYATLVRDHPNFNRMDEVLFSLAFALQELDQFDKARSVYRRLIKDYPRSRFVPNAYLSFAEFYFNDSDMDAAAKFYRKVLEFPPKRNSVYGYALYKVAWVEYNRERYRQSLQGFVDILEFARNNKYANDAKNLARQARKELVLPYSHYGSPGKALDFFRRYSKSEAEAHEMLENLGNLYYDTGQWPQAVTVYHKLMADTPRSNSLCDWQTKVTNAVISSRPKQDQIIELKRLVDIYRNYKKGGKPVAKVEECKVETATTMLWLGTSWHREAVGTDAAPGTKNKKTMSQAAVLYRTLLKEFPDMEQMKFPNIDKRDWPTKYKLSYFYAELLWKMEEWGQCGATPPTRRCFATTTSTSSSTCRARPSRSSSARATRGRSRTRRPRRRTSSCRRSSRSFRRACSRRSIGTCVTSTRQKIYRRSSIAALASTTRPIASKRPPCCSATSRSTTRTAISRSTPPTSISTASTCSARRSLSRALLAFRSSVPPSTRCRRRSVAPSN